MRCDTTCISLFDTLGHYGETPNKKSPFKLFIFPELTDTKSADKLRDDISSSIKLRLKDNDLYKFKQSKDLKTEIASKKLTECLHSFIDIMLGPVKAQLEKVIEKKLSDKYFDITVSRYDKGDYLLCHNDDIKDSFRNHRRALAFVYYLTSRPWRKADGGAFILFDSDSSGEPIGINNRLFPRPNTLLVFETTPTSWHSVQEVYCNDDSRLSINGWFHFDGPCRSSEREETFEMSPYTFLRPTLLDDRLENFFRECLNQDYLMDKTCTLIRRRFQRKSEINLTDFLVEEKFNEISEALKEATQKEENLVHVGPYNKRNYKVLKVDALPPICRDLYDAFRSDLFYLLLSRLTGLDLQPPAINQWKKAGDKDDKAANVGKRGERGKTKEKVKEKEKVDEKKKIEEQEKTEEKGKEKVEKKKEVNNDKEGNKKEENEEREKSAKDREDVGEQEHEENHKDGEGQESDDTDTEDDDDDDNDDNSDNDNDSEEEEEDNEDEEEEETEEEEDSEEDEDDTEEDYVDIQEEGESVARALLMASDKEKETAGEHSRTAEAKSTSEDASRKVDIQQAKKVKIDKYDSTETKLSQDIRTDEEPTTSKGKIEKAPKAPRRQPRKRLSNPSDPFARLEYRFLEAGSYTLIHDHGFELGEKSALDVILHFNHPFGVNFDNGGYISYIDGSSEDDLHDMNYELLTVEPKSNCLSLVYRCDEGTCRFLKHMNRSHQSSYHDLYCVYYEKVEDLPDHQKYTIE